MAITLTHPTAGPGSTALVLELPPDLIWTDEFAWAKVAQQLEYSSTGALMIDEWTKQAGRPITLAGTVDYGWCQRSALQTLNTWSGQAGVVFALGWNGQGYSVTWDRSGNPITAEPVVPYSDPQDADPYSLTLRLLAL